MKKQFNLLLLVLFTLVFFVGCQERPLYKVTEDGSLLLHNEEKLEPDVVIPSEVDGIKVTSINTFTFSKVRSMIKTLTVSEGITVVDGFIRCENLVEVNLPKSLEKIEVGAFSGCTSLKEIIIPNNVTEIGGGAFKDCTNLKYIKLPDNLTEIGYATFEGCTSLEKITLPNGIIGIGPKAFSNCTALKEIIIPDLVRKIELEAFSGCTSLEKVTFGESVSYISYLAFANCSSLEEIVLTKEGDRTTTSGDIDAFHNTPLKRVYVPENSYKGYANKSEWWSLKEFFITY